MCYLNDDAETSWAYGTLFPGGSWAMYVVYTSGELTTDLIRNQNYDVGDAYIMVDGGYLVVKIVLDEGYSISHYHTHVAASLGGIPRNRAGNPRIGLFEYYGNYSETAPSIKLYLPLDAAEQSAGTLSTWQSIWELQPILATANKKPCRVNTFNLDFFSKPV